MSEVLEKVKISQLDLVQDYTDLYTIGTDWQLHSVKVPLAVLATIGSIANLNTANKSTLVAAINEVFAAAGSGGGSNLSGYVVVSSIANLPDPGQPNLGYLVGENLYLYVGTGGDTRNGKYKNCGPFRGPQGPQGIQGPQGYQGDPGAPGVTSVNASVSPSTGTPAVTYSLVDGLLTLNFSGLKGETGATGATGAQGTQGPQGIQGPRGETGSPGVTSASASIDGTTGIPEVVCSLVNGALAFAFSGLKGETGPQGVQGPQGTQGPRGIQGPAGVDTVQIAVNNNTGTPSATATLVNGVLTITISGIKGEQGNSGSSVSYPFELVNNCIEGGEDKALSAEQGKVINQKIENKFVFLTEQEFEALSSFDPAKIYCTYEG